MVIETAYRVMMFALVFGIFGLTVFLLAAAAWDSWAHGGNEPDTMTESTEEEEE